MKSTSDTHKTKYFEISIAVMRCFFRIYKEVRK